MSNWRYPSLSIHGIEGAFSGPGFKTVIPRKVIGKFSIRLVPNQDPLKISEQVKEYIMNVWKKRQSPNKLKVIIFEIFIKFIDLQFSINWDLKI